MTSTIQPEQDVGVRRLFRVTDQPVQHSRHVVVAKRVRILVLRSSLESCFPVGSAQLSAFLGGQCNDRRLLLATFVGGIVKGVPDRRPKLDRQRKRHPHRRPGTC